MKAGVRCENALMICLAALLLGCSHPAAKVTHSWDRKAAASYLDYREGWWTDGRVPLAITTPSAYRVTPPYPMPSHGPHFVHHSPNKGHRPTNSD